MDNIMSKEVAVGFDYTHNNKLTIENNAFTDFIQYCFTSGFKLGKIEAGISHDKLEKYDLFIIGVPNLGPELDSDEIKDLGDYIKNGGSLLIINDGGGDYENRNNLSELTKNFGIKFNSDRLFDNKYFSKNNSHPIIKDFRSHFITKDIHKIIHSNGCTLSIDKSIESEEIDVKSIAFSSENTSWHSIFTGDGWEDESKQNLSIIGVVHYYLGKVVAIGNLSIFSSLNKSYGIKAANNFKLVSNIISWLLNKAKSKGEQTEKPIFATIALNQDNYFWIKEMIDNGKYNNMEELVNFALRIAKLKIKEGLKDDQDR